MTVERVAESDPSEIENSRMILGLFEWADSISQALAEHRNPSESSSLAVDDGRTPHFPVSDYASGQLTVALGCVSALRDLIVRESEASVSLIASPFGSYSLVRNTVDAAATCLWLLEPVNGTLRVKRRILLQVDEVRNGAELRRSMGASSSAWKKAKRARLRQVTEQAGIEAWNPLKQDLPTMTSVLRNVERHHNDVLVPWIAVWQLASGHAHGKMWAQTASHALEELPGSRTETGATFRVTIKYGMLAALLLETMKLIDAAASRYLELAKG